MVWVIDDLAEAALGPWGVAVAVGVGLVTAVRQRKAVASALPNPPAAAWATGGLGSAAAAADGVKGRVQTALAEAGEYWRDLYAEAQHEWRQERSGSAPKTAAATPSTRRTARTAPAAGKRVRGPNGRYVRE